MIGATLAFNDVHVLISHRISANIVVLLYRSGKVLLPYKAWKYDWDLCDGFADICERLFLLIVLRPNGIFGITKSKQYDKMPAGIPSLIAVPVPDASEILVAENYVRAGIAESFTNKHHYYNK